MESMMDKLKAGLENFGKQLQCGVCMEQFNTCVCSQGVGWSE